MRDQSIRTHLANLEQQGELIRFTAEIDPDETMSAVSHRSFAELGKSCLFENIAGEDLAGYEELPYHPGCGDHDNPSELNGRACSACLVRSGHYSKDLFHRGDASSDLDQPGLAEGEHPLPDR